MRRATHDKALAVEVHEHRRDGRYVVHERATMDGVLPCCGNHGADTPPWDRMALTSDFSFMATCPQLVKTREKT